MIYTFRSKAAGDLIMLGPDGDRVMAALGREPSAKGIFEAGDLAALIARLEAAAAAEPPPSGDGKAAAGSAGDGDEAGALVGMKARVWPLVEMMRRAQAAGEPIVWGV